MAEAAQIAAAARAAWPGLALSVEQFLADLAGRPLTRATAADLYLACACARGEPAAIRILEQRFLPRAARAAAGVDRAPEFVDEVRQRLRDRLLAGPRPRIAGYAGSGALESWLCVAAMRLAVNLRRDRGRADRAVGSDGVPPSPDPELRLVRERHGADLERALRDALAGLPAAARRMLRLHDLDGLTLAEIGARRRVHASTVSRQLEAARRQVLDETKRLLRERLRIGEDSVDSLIRAVRDEVDVTVRRLLA